MKKTKTIVIPLLSGEMKRIVKKDIACIEEQLNIEGGIDVEVWMKSGWRYLTATPKKVLEHKIYQ